MRRLLSLAFRSVCYFALAVVVAGVASLIFVSKMDVCPRLDEGQIACATPFYESLANFGMSVALVTVFTGLPGILAIGGLVYLIRDLFFRSRRSDGSK